MVSNINCFEAIFRKEALPSGLFHSASGRLCSTAVNETNVWLLFFVYCVFMSPDKDVQTNHDDADVSE